jgi:hypothetical protein
MLYKRVPCSSFGVARAAILAMSLIRNDESAAKPVVLSIKDPIDFWYVRGQAEVSVPFAVQESCAEIFLDELRGIVIDSVVADGVPVANMEIRNGTSDGPDIHVGKTGPSYRYVMRLDRLISVSLGSPFSGRAFPLSMDSLPARVEVHYRVRCADGKVGDPSITRGVLLTLNKGAVVRPAKARAAATSPQDAGP